MQHLESPLLGVEVAGAQQSVPQTRGYNRPAPTALCTKAELCPVRQQLDSLECLAVTEGPKVAHRPPYLNSIQRPSGPPARLSPVPILEETIPVE